jgi:hypothetical protein
MYIKTKITTNSYSLFIFNHYFAAQKAQLEEQELFRLVQSLENGQNVKSTACSTFINA